MYIPPYDTFSSSCNYGRGANAPDSTSAVVHSTDVKDSVEASGRGLGTMEGAMWGNARPFLQSIRQ